MYKSILTAIVLMASIPVLAQKNVQKPIPSTSAINPNLLKDKSIKLNLGVGMGRFTYEENYSQKLTFSPAFQWRNAKNNFEEIGVNLGYMAGTFNGFRGHNDGLISLHYAYFINFLKQMPSKWMPSLGLAANPYFRWQFYTPEVTNKYPLKDWTIGVVGVVVPRITYHLSKNFYLEASATLGLLEMGIRRHQLNDPNLTLNQQQWTALTLNGFAHFGCNVGIGWAF